MPRNRSVWRAIYKQSEYFTYCVGLIHWALYQPDSVAL
jgi:hypothetical protein